MKCKKCKNDTFRVEKRTCETCVMNEIWDGENWVRPQSSADFHKERNSEMNGECAMGSNYNKGCTLMTCSGCGSSLMNIIEK